MESLLKSFEHDSFQKIWITPERFEQTLKLRVKYLDKPRISFTDLSSMVVMKELGINQILTDDDHSHLMEMGLIKVPSI
jgi:predicted nucleic acid-binding protein